MKDFAALENYKLEVENLKQNNNENVKVDSSLITNIRDPTG